MEQGWSLMAARPPGEGDKCRGHHRAREKVKLLPKGLVQPLQPTPRSLLKACSEKAEKTTLGSSQHCSYKEQMLHSHHWVKHLITLGNASQEPEEGPNSMAAFRCMKRALLQLCHHLLPSIRKIWQLAAAQGLLSLSLVMQREKASRKDRVEVALGIDRVKLLVDIATKNAG